uniref:Uncharacterized protein n=1 Tax=Anguilla anguilla TaxID=7936 RepID=A0A0E9TXT6_ANGAN
MALAWIWQRFGTGLALCIKLLVQSNRQLKTSLTHAKNEKNIPHGDINVTALSYHGPRDKIKSNT